VVSTGILHLECANIGADQVLNNEIYKLKEKLRVRDPNSTLPDSADMTFLDNLELIRWDGEQAAVTVAGLLFVGKEQSIRHYLPQAEVIYLHYSENNQQEYDNRLDLQQPIVTILDTLTERLRAYNRLTNVQVGLFRMEIYDFPEAVFQEALLNALSHRSYESGGAVYIKHYPNKIVVENPGNFPEGVTIDNIITHQSMPRNKLIATTLQRLKYVQRSGQGVDIMYQSMLLGGKPYPEYTVFSDSVRLTLQSNVENEAFIKFVAEEQDRNGKLLGLSKLMLLRCLSDHKKIALAQAAKTIQETKNVASKELDELRSMGLVELSGREYMLTARVYEQLKNEVAYVQDKTIQLVKAQARIMDYLAQKPSINRPAVQELCGYNQNQASYLLGKMAKENVLERHGSGRGTYYTKK
jgi:ATP-dependent DNA helicase RecG